MNNEEQKTFYQENTFDKKSFTVLKQGGNESMLIMTYNVHNWQNLNSKVSDDDNYKQIYKFIKKSGAEILVFQEVRVSGRFSLKFITDDYSDLGFKYHAVCINGSSIYDKNQNSFILVLSKYKIDVAKKIDVTIGKSIRECLYVSANGFRFIAVHLEIGDRFHDLVVDSLDRKQIVYNNVLKRKWQLSRIFAGFETEGIDAIVGDFNFNIDDPEFKWLIEEKKYIWDMKRVMTTPYNRVDFLLLNSKSKYTMISSTVVKCNFSDHLPVVTEVELISVE